MIEYLLYASPFILLFLGALAAKAMGRNTHCPSIRLYEGGLH